MSDEEQDAEEAIHIPFFHVWMSIKNPNDAPHNFLRFVPTPNYDEFVKMMTPKSLADIVAVITQYTLDSRPDSEQVAFLEEFKEALKEKLDEGILLDPSTW
jgi:hypothetical protein